MFLLVVEFLSVIAVISIVKYICRNYIAKISLPSNNDNRINESVRNSELL